MLSESAVCVGDEVLAKDYIWGCEEPDAGRATRLQRVSEDGWRFVTGIKRVERGVWLEVQFTNDCRWWIELSDVVEARRRFVPSGVAEGESL